MPLSRYVERWGRPATRRWSRSRPSRSAPRGTGSSRAENPGFGFVDDETPELTIAVVPSRRGKGAELLEALLAQARTDGFSRISLDYEDQAPYYERFGFEMVRESAMR